MYGIYIYTPTCGLNLLGHVGEYSIHGPYGKYKVMIYFVNSLRINNITFNTKHNKSTSDPSVQGRHPRGLPGIGVPQASLQSDAWRPRRPGKLQRQ